MVPENCHVRITIYNIQGQIVKTVVDNELPAGEYEASWDGKDKSGNKVANGIYLYKMETKKINLLKKMFLFQ